MSCYIVLQQPRSIILEEPLCVADCCRFSSENFGAAAGAHQYIRADDFFHITITLLSNSDASDDKKHHEKFPLKITQPCVFVLSFWRKNSVFRRLSGCILSKRTLRSTFVHFVNQIIWIILKSMKKLKKSFQLIFSPFFLYLNFCPILFPLKSLLESLALRYGLSRSSTCLLHRILIWPLSSTLKVFEQPNKQEQENIHNEAGMEKHSTNKYFVSSKENLWNQKLWFSWTNLHVMWLNISEM